MTTVAIHQPNYMPWLGYFRKIALSDIFVFYDNVQMPMGKSLVSRNQFKSPQGLKWLTVPTVKSGTPGLIRETSIVSGNWPGKHVGSLKNWYGGSKCLDDVCSILEDAYQVADGSIATLNISIIKALCSLSGLAETRFVLASEMKHGIVGSESIMEILKELEASKYLTGQGAGSMRHLDIESMVEQGIQTEFLSTEFAPYPQRHGEFEPGLSAVDALLNIGPDAFRDLLSL